MGNPDKVKVGAGLLYVGPLGTVEPTNLTTPWATVDVDWVPIGYTEDGHEFSREPSFEGIEVAEEKLPIRWEKTSETATVSFSAAEITVANLKIAFNGGTVTTLSGTVVRFEPPAITDEDVRIMLGWESNDGSERWVFRKCVNTSATTIARRKAPTKALIPVTLNLEVPAAGILPFTSILDTNPTA